MSNVIDQKVVEMRFDNSNFEANTSKTMATLAKLKESLKLQDSSRGLESVNVAAKKIDFNPLSSAVDTVQAKFSALEVMGVTALANITNAAVNAGKNFAKSLTIDPISSGFQEYETQMNAVQTILANTESKGTTIKDVNAALGELNEYADQTIYNFTEMTRNIGTFTAAGVDLDTSVNAIKGIANLAAVSGSSSQQASTAMYQLSQALSTGTVKLQDWISVNNAGLGGEGFQERLKETARAHGVAVDQIIEEEGNFRESLHTGWLSSDILLETLNKYTLTTEGLTKAEIKKNKEMLKSKGYTDEQIKSIFKLGKTATDAATKVKTITQLIGVLQESAQSGWAQSWQLIVGDFEEAKGLLTTLSDRFTKIIEASANARNEMLTVWKDKGGRDALIKSFNNILDAVGSVVKPVKKAFREFFPRTTGKQLAAITKQFQKFTKNLKISGETAYLLKRTFRGVFAVLDIVKTAVMAVLKGVVKLIGGGKGLATTFLKTTAKMGDWLVKLNYLIKKHEVFNKIVDGTIEAIKFLFNGIRKVLSGIRDFFSEIPGIRDFMNAFAGVFDSLKSGFDTVGKSVNGMSTSFSKALASIKSTLEQSQLYKLLLRLWEIIKKIAYALGDTLLKAIRSILDDFSRGDFSGLLNTIMGILGVGILKKVKAIMSNVESFTKIGQSFIGILDGIRNCLKAYQDQLKAGTILKVAIAVGILAASLFLLAGLEPVQLATALGAIGALFLMIIIAFKVVDNFLNEVGKNGDKKLKLIDKLKERLSKFVDTLSIAVTLIGIATAVYILASAVRKVGRLSWEEIAKGLTVVTVLLAEMVAATVIVGKNIKEKIKGVRAIIAFASGVRVLVEAVQMFSNMSWEQIAKGLIGVNVLMAALVGAAKLLTMNGKHFRNFDWKIAAGLIGIALAVKLLAGVCKDFADMDWGQFTRGVGGVAAITSMMIGFIGLTKIFFGGKFDKDIKKIVRGYKSDDFMTVAKALIAMAIAIKIVANVAVELGNLSWEQAARGLGSVAVITSLFVGLIAFNRLLKPENVMDYAKSMLVMSTAIAIVGIVVKMLSKMSWEEAAKGLLALAAITSIFAGFMAISKLIDPGDMIKASTALVIMASALAIVSLSIGLLAMIPLPKLAAGVIAAAAALAALTGSAVLLSKSEFKEGVYNLLFISSSLLILAIAIKVLSGIPVGGIIVGLVALAACVGVIVVAAYALQPVIAVFTQFGAAIAWVGVGVLAFGMGVVLLSIGLLKLCDAFIQVGQHSTEFFGGISKLVGTILQKVIEFIPTLIEKIGEGIVKIIVFIGNAVPEIIEAVRKILLGIIKLIVDVVPELVDALFTLISKALQSLASHIGEWVDSLMQILINIINAIGERLPELIDAAVKLVLKLFTAVVDSIKGIAPGEIAKALEGAGIIAMILTVLGGLSLLAPAAMAGVLETTAVISTLMGLLMMFGAIKQIPGITWLISEGGEFLKLIGQAIGKFIGGIIGGVIDAASESLPKLGENLSQFMQKMQPFLDGAVNIKPESLDGVEKLVTIIGMLTDNAMKEKMVSWAGGNSSMLKFAVDILVLGRGLKAFSKEVENFSSDDVKTAIHATEAIGVLAGNLPRDGGIVDVFAGSNNLDTFASYLPDFGKHLVAFSKSVEGMNSKDVVAAANAAKVVAEFAKEIPNEGGALAFFVGDNKLDEFADMLPRFGTRLKAFSLNVNGMKTGIATKAGESAKVIAEFAKEIPNNGGALAFFVGENKLDDFGAMLPQFGKDIAAFATNVEGMKNKSARAAANSAKVIAEFAKGIPNEGGALAFFVGDNTLSHFADMLPGFGTNLKDFSVNVEGMKNHVVHSAASAAGAIAEFAKDIPNDGGALAFFVGDNRLDKFGEMLPDFGTHMRQFSENSEGVRIGHVVSVSTAAKAIIDAMDGIKPEGGVVQMWNGTANLESFGSQLASFGNYMTDFSNNTSEITDSGRLVTLCTDIATIMDKINSMEFNSEALNGIDTYSEQVAKIPGIVLTFGTNATYAAFFVKPETIDNFKTVIDKLNGIVEYISAVDVSKVDTYATAMKDLASLGLISFKDQVTDSKDEIQNAAKDMINNLVEGINNNQDTLKDRMKQLATDSVDALSNTQYDYGKAGQSVIDRFAAGMDAKSSGITTNLSTLINNSLGDMSTTYANMTTAGQTIASNLAGGISSNISTVSDAMRMVMAASYTTARFSLGDFTKIGQSVISNLAAAFKSSKPSSSMRTTAYWAKEAVREKYSDFYSAGSYLVTGFANGIDDNTYRAEAQARAMAKAAAEAAKKALHIHSPSKVFYEIGDYSGMGFVNALNDYQPIAYSAGENMADNARNGLSKAIKSISAIVENDVDTSPTIRPVLDLSDVSAGVSTMSSMLDVNPSVDVMGNLSSINTGVQEIQNGANGNVISAIKELGHTMSGNPGNTYNINGITYDDGSNVANAIETLVRAVVVERRV